MGSPISLIPYDPPTTRAKSPSKPTARMPPPQKKTRFTYPHKVMTAPCAQVLLLILGVVINSLGPGYERRRRRRREEGPPWGHLRPRQDHSRRRDGDRPPRAEEGDALRHRAVSSKGTSDGAGTGPRPKARRPNQARARNFYWPGPSLAKEDKNDNGSNGRKQR